MQCDFVGVCSGTLEELFEEFAEQPVASGSIAQIHKARLSDEGARGSEYPPGTVVAVKVIHQAALRNSCVQQAALHKHRRHNCQMQEPKVANSPQELQLLSR